MARAPEVLRVLLVEDDEDDYLITRDMLAGQERARFEVEWCDDYDAALAAMREQRHDVYLVDYRLGLRTGLDLVREGFNRRHAPVLILTGQSDYEIDLEATALGVTDYLVKQELDPVSLERSIRYAVSHQKALHDLTMSEERYALAVRAANDGIWDWDLASGRIYFSPRWHAILGRAEGAGGDEDPTLWFDLVHTDDLLRLRAAIDAHVAGETPYLQSEHRIRHSDGTWRWVLTRGLATCDADGRPTRMAGSLSDITDRLSAERQLQHDALHDVLTGLPNRALFTDRVTQVLQRGTREPGLGCAVLFVDIDRFKLVNDSLSHAVGDQLLVALAGRLSRVLRPGDTVARMGGDEFTVLLEGVDSTETAVIAAERVQRTLGESVEVDGHDLFVTASIGIALSSPRMNASELLRNADIAMYDAKRRGRARFALFDESMHRRLVDRLARENELRQAVEQSLLQVHYQPIVDLATGRLQGFEALARWPAQWSTVPPCEFIPIAEETGMIGALGTYVLRTALDTLAGWRSAGLVGDDVTMSVNVSPRQLDDPQMPERVCAAIAAAGLQGSALRLEITESTLMLEPERMQRIVSEVCSTGVGLHLDDFGTGYSSLSALRRFPVDALKIDRSFVASIHRKADGSEVIVRSTIALAQSLGLRVIAEGIEDLAQARRLQLLECEYGQGYLFSRPVGRKDAELLLATWSPARAIGDGAAVAPGGICS